MTTLVWDHWHIEPSSICTLKCPRCPRSEISESLLNRQLDLKFFQQQIGDHVVRQIRKITFCGNDGDPIYCKELLEICRWLKSCNTEIQLVIVTNGSYKPVEWWSELGSILNHRDEINWSLDGWDQNSNEQYRVNSDWNSIIDGYHTFTKQNQSTYKVWAAIAFRFNQNHINRMQLMADSLGFDLFQLTKSTKFGSHYPDAYGINDPLCPDRTDLVSSSHRFERVLVDLTTKTRPGQHLKEIFFTRAGDLQKQQKYSAICLIGNKGVFLNSQGEFYPCCWTANRYEHNQQWLHKFNLKNRTFRNILEDEFWTTDFLKFDSLECTTKCTKEKLQDLQHTTEW